MKGFLLIAAIALCLCLAAPAAADMLPGFTSGGIFAGLNPFPAFKSQGSFGGVIIPGVQDASVSFSPTVVDYVDSGCIPNPFNGGCSGTYSGKIDGGTIFYSVITLDGSSFAMTGKIYDGSFAGQYAIDLADEHSFVSDLDLSFTSSAWSRTTVNTVLLPWFSPFGSVDIFDTCIGPRCASFGGIVMTTTVVPEPSSLTLLGGLLVFTRVLRRKLLYLTGAPRTDDAVAPNFARGN